MLSQLEFAAPQLFVQLLDELPPCRRECHDDPVDLYFEFVVGIAIDWDDSDYNSHYSKTQDFYLLIEIQMIQNYFQYHPRFSAGLVLLPVPVSVPV